MSAQNIQREPIYAALFALVSDALGDALKTKSRTLKHWNDVQTSAMPAFFLSQGAQVPTQAGNMPVKWMLTGTIHLYVSNKAGGSPSEAANPIVDAITRLFETNGVGAPQTLGGLVQWARIVGTIETSEGTLGEKEVIQIPVQMLTV